MDNLSKSAKHDKSESNRFDTVENKNGARPTQAVNQSIKRLGRNEIPPGKEGLPESYSQSRLADIFEHERGGDFKYVAAWQTWLQFENNLWRREGADAAARDLIENITRRASRHGLDSEELKPRDARVIAGHNYVAGVERAARDRRSFRSAADEWDRHTLLMGVPDGVIDLETGKRRASERALRITQSAAVAPADSSAGAVKWLKALDVIYERNEEVIKYVQKLCGYCLTGEVTEDLLIVAYGRGGNGKTVVFSTLGKVLGSYAHILAAEALMQTYGERHPEELFRLQKKRLALAAEIPTGATWNTERLKMLSGRDVVSAREMYGKSVNFPPTHKLIIYGNNLPGFKAIDDAVRGRVRIIPHRVAIRGNPKLEIKELENELIAEWPSILRWFIEGAALWQKKGLAELPEPVAAATGNYLSAEDEFGGYMQSRTVGWPDNAADARNDGKPCNKTALSDFVRDYNDWRNLNAGGVQLKPVDSTRMSRKMRDFGCQIEHFRDGSHVWRLRLKPE